MQERKTAEYTLVIREVHSLNMNYLEKSYTENGTGGLSVSAM